MSFKNNYDVAVIVLNWNSYKDTFECLKSLKNLTYPHFHVFLVDNQSGDNSFENLQQNYNEGLFNLGITFIQTGANLGFAGGNNVGIKEAFNLGFQYFWMLNNDTVIEPDTLSPLVSTLEREKNVGIVGSKIYYYGTNNLWFAGGKVNTWTGKTKHIGYKEDDKGQYDSLKEVDYVTGCSLFFRRELLEDVGYMNEKYFLYYEETDWNIRASQNGWKILYNPLSVVYHKVSMSSGGEGNLAPYVNYYDIRNAFWMIKNTQSKVKRITAYFFAFYKAIKGIAKIYIFNLPGKINRIKNIFGGLREL